MQHGVRLAGLALQDQKRIRCACKTQRAGKGVGPPVPWCDNRRARPAVAAPFVQSAFLTGGMYPPTPNRELVPAQQLHFPALARRGCCDARVSVCELVVVGSNDNLAVRLKLADRFSHCC